jgi:hypothetical protein
MKTSTLKVLLKLKKLAVIGAALTLSASPNFASAQDKGAFNRFRGCPGDITADGVVDRLDIDAITYTSSNVMALDVNRDMLLSSRDKRAVAGLRGQCAARADFNADGRVDGVDLALLLGGFGSVTEGTAAYDLSGDGLIDQVDTDILQASWGTLSVLRPKSLDLNRDGRIDNCDAMTAHPTFGITTARGDVNKDGVRDFDDYNLVIGFLSRGAKIKPAEWQKACRKVR